MKGVRAMSYVGLSKTQLEVFQVKGVSYNLQKQEYYYDLKDFDQVILPLMHNRFSPSDLYFPVIKDLNDYRNLNSEADVIEAVEKFLDLATRLEKKGYKLFVFDMKSLYFDADLKPYVYLYYPIYTQNDSYPQKVPDIQIFVSPKIMNFETNNSQIVAEIFARLKYQERFASKPSLRDRRKFTIESLKLENEIDLADWFRKSHENKYSMEECKLYFEAAIQKRKYRMCFDEDCDNKVFKGFKVGYATFEGTEKIKETDDYKKSEEVNQDAYLYERWDNCAIAAIMDGVSTSRVGNGNISANIVKETLKEKWETYKLKELTDEEVKAFFEEVIRESNEKIIQKAKEISESMKFSPNDIMSSTMLVALLKKDIVYICSVGDSPAYIATKECMKRLNVEHNVEFEKLMNETDFKANSKENCNSLTQYIGKAKTAEDRIVPDEISYQFLKTRLLENEILILCSDGVIDYSPGNDDEEKEENFRKIFFKHFEKTGKLKSAVYKTIAEIDELGAEDNITLIAIKPEFETAFQKENSQAKIGKPAGDDRR